MAAADALVKEYIKARLAKRKARHERMETFKRDKNVVKDTSNLNKRGAKRMECWVQKKVLFPAGKLTLCPRNFAKKPLKKLNPENFGKTEEMKKATQNLRRARRSEELLLAKFEEDRDYVWDKMEEQMEVSTGKLNCKQ